LDFSRGKQDPENLTQSMTANSKRKKKKKSEEFEVFLVVVLELSTPNREATASRETQLTA
jgi:hypothetical protein